MYVREEKLVFKEIDKEEKERKDILELEEWFVDSVKQGNVIVFGDAIVYRGP